MIHMMNPPARTLNRRLLVVKHPLGGGSSTLYQKSAGQNGTTNILCSKKSVCSPVIDKTVNDSKG
jgi:hypothetical protein